MLIMLLMLAATASIKVVFDYARAQRGAEDRGTYSSIEERFDRKILSVQTLMSALSCQNDLQQVLTNNQLYRTKDGWDNLLTLMFQYSTLEKGIDSVVTSNMSGDVNWYYYYQDQTTYTDKLDHAIDNPGISSVFVLGDKPMFTISREITKYSTAQFSGRHAQSERIGTCVFFIDLNDIVDELGFDDISGGHAFALFDSEGKLFWQGGNFSDAMLDEARNMDLTADEEGSSFSVKVSGAPYTAYITKSSVTGFTLLGMSNGPMLAGSMAELAMRMTLNWGIVVLLTLALIAFLYRNIDRFIRFLQANMERCRDAGGKLRMEYFSKREFSVVADTFNEMLDRIEQLSRDKMDMQEKLYREELDRRDVSLTALQSQVNPHFLFNTLECIKSLGVCFGVDEIRVICESLAKMMRYSIDERSLATLSEELASVENYISIQNVRFDGRFKLDMRIDDDCRTSMILRMLLQPLVENAFIHGFGKRPGPGRLSVSVEKSGEDSLLLTIADDGAGMTEDELNRLYEYMNSPIDVHTGSVGLRNVSQRLKLYYNERAKIRVESESGKGTRVTLVVPIVEGERRCIA